MRCRARRERRPSRRSAPARALAACAVHRLGDAVHARRGSADGACATRAVWILAGEEQQAMTRAEAKSQSQRGILGVARLHTRWLPAPLLAPSLRLVSFRLPRDQCDTCWPPADTPAANRLTPRRGWGIACPPGLSGSSSAQNSAINILRALLYSTDGVLSSSASGDVQMSQFHADLRLLHASACDLSMLVHAAAPAPQPIDELLPSRGLLFVDNAVVCGLVCLALHRSREMEHRQSHLPTIGIASLPQYGPRPNAITEAAKKTASCMI